MKVKEDREKADLKLNIQKTKIKASGPITSWQIYGETMETMTSQTVEYKFTERTKRRRKLRLLTPSKGPYINWIRLWSNLYQSIFKRACVSAHMHVHVRACARTHTHTTSHLVIHQALHLCMIPIEDHSEA